MADPLTLDWYGWTREDGDDGAFFILTHTTGGSLYFRKVLRTAEWRISYKLSRHPSHPIVAVQRPAAPDLARAEIDAIAALSHAIRSERHRLAAMVADLGGLEVGLPPITQPVLPLAMRWP